MIKNYILIALRNILRQKVYSIITISGLIVAFVTVSSQTLKAALINPIEITI